MMDVHKTPGGRWELRWREAGRRRSRTFDRKGDAEKFDSDRRRRKQLGQAAVPDDVPLSELALTYWRLHAVPNLASSTRDYYRLALEKHIVPRLGDYGVRELTPGRINRFSEELQAGAGPATVRKVLAVLQSVLSFAVSEELLQYNPASTVRKPRYDRAREPRIFLPGDVEAVRARLELRDRTLVSVLAYSGPRPQEVVFRLSWADIGERTIRYRDTKRRTIRYTPLLAPLAEDLREWFMACGRPADRVPVFPAHDGDFWGEDDWRNWRARVWQGRRPGRRDPSAARSGCAPAGTRPRDLRSSFITVQVYAGVPLTQIAREVGTSVGMIERHYAGVLEDWDGVQVPAETQIRRARLTGGRTMDVLPGFEGFAR